VNARRWDEVRALLEVSGLSHHFGGVQALSNIDLTVEAGSVCAVIGPNGAGKSTLLNALTGLIRPTAGRIVFEKEDLAGWPTHRIIGKGIGRTFQSGRLFARLTALENVLVGGHPASAGGFPAIVAGLPRLRREEDELTARAEHLLQQLRLADTRDTMVGALPYGRRRLIELGRVLMSEPKLILLDEPAAGLNSGEVKDLIHLLGALRGGGMTILVIEHNMGLVMRLADRIAVLNFGEKIAEGSPSEIQRDERVLEAYLGQGYRHAG
jgi:branched-chain amino acid transport system ATP-binding protein